jgi:hypothetical protein
MGGSGEAEGFGARGACPPQSESEGGDGCLDTPPNINQQLAMGRRAASAHQRQGRRALAPPKLPEEVKAEPTRLSRRDRNAPSR